MLIGAHDRKNTRLTRISIKLVFFLLANFLLLLLVFMPAIDSLAVKAQQTLM